MAKKTTSKKGPARNAMPKPEYKKFVPPWEELRGFLESAPHKYPADAMGVAALFADANILRLRYVREPACWYLYNGVRWQPDTLGAARLVQEFARNLALLAADGEGDLPRMARSLYPRRRREELLRDAACLYPMSLAEFDADPLLLNLQNCAFDLREHVAVLHNPLHFCTHVAGANYDIAAPRDTWNRFVQEVCGGDKSLAEYLRGALSYALSGENRWDCFHLLYGPGTRNGKSTLLEAVAAALGDYARAAQPEILRGREGGGPSPELARLRGARLVIMPEPRQTLRLDAALVKQITGRDTITARMLHQNPVEFRPQFKLFLASNHLPQVEDDTLFQSGRARVIPFLRSFAPKEQDVALPERLRAPRHQSAILNWLLAGWRRIQPNDLYGNADCFPQMPDICEAYTARWQRGGGAEPHGMSQWLQQRVGESPGAVTKTNALYEDYAQWLAQAAGDKPLCSRQQFVGELRGRYTVFRHMNLGNVIKDFALRA